MKRLKNVLGLKLASLCFTRCWGFSWKINKSILQPEADSESSSKKVNSVERELFLDHYQHFFWPVESIVHRSSSNNGLLPTRHDSRENMKIINSLRRMQSETVLAASVENVRKCQENDKQSSWRASGKQKNMFQSSLSESITLAFKQFCIGKSSSTSPSSIMNPVRVWWDDGSEVLGQIEDITIIIV